MDFSFLGGDLFKCDNPYLASVVQQEPKLRTDDRKTEPISFFQGIDSIHIV